jgi:glucoamylase
MTVIQALPLAEWADAQLLLAAEKMALGISATHLKKRREGFGQTIRPAKGSVLAAFASAYTATEPDYFFHWLRDSAAIMDAGLALIRNRVAPDAWAERFADFVRFSLATTRISGRQFLAETPDLQSRTIPEYRQYLRPEAELASIEGDRVLGDVRHNADGTLDFLRWSRPQHDGPAARALACLRFWDADAILHDARADAAELIRLDLGYTYRHAGVPCFDIWEEDNAEHYYTVLLQCEALRQGTVWLEAQGEAEMAAKFDDAAERLASRLEDFWSPEKGFLLSRLMPPGQTTGKELDLAVILGLLHSGRRVGPHSVADPRAAETLQSLEALFAGHYALNRAAGAPLAFGRYKDDSYFSGGAYFFCTLAAAEFYYALAELRGDAHLLAKGDAILAMARRSIPPSGEMSEQFDQTTGEQTSAKSLTWSYAAFITAWDARKRAAEKLGGLVH